MVREIKSNLELPRLMIKSKEDKVVVRINNFGIWTEHMHFWQCCCYIVIFHEPGLLLLPIVRLEVLLPFVSEYGTQEIWQTSSVGFLGDSRQVARIICHLLRRIFYNKSLRNSLVVGERFFLVVWLFVCLWGGGGIIQLLSSVYKEFLLALMVWLAFLVRSKLNRLWSHIYGPHRLPIVPVVHQMWIGKAN